MKTKGSRRQSARRLDNKTKIDSRAFLYVYNTLVGIIYNAVMWIRLWFVPFGIKQTINDARS